MCFYVVAFVQVRFVVVVALRMLHPACAVCGAPGSQRGSRPVPVRPKVLTQRGRLGL